MKIIDIYTDGSHLDKLNNGRLGCGGVMVERTDNGYGKVLQEFGKELEKDFLIKKYGTDNCSNPTAEMLGVLVALTEFRIPIGSEVIIHADYIGVKEWMNGNWKIKEPYIAKVKSEIDEIIRRKGINISFDWVKAHQPKSSLNRDAYWNNYVDLLAKGQKKK